MLIQKQYTNIALPETIMCVCIHYPTDSGYYLVVFIYELRFSVISEFLVHNNVVKNTKSQRQSEVVLLAEHVVQNILKNDSTTSITAGQSISASCIS